MGNFIAQALVEKVGENASPWPAWYEAAKDPSSILTTELARHVDGTIGKSWMRMASERRAFLELLSRIDLNLDQAIAVATPEGRQDNDIDFRDEDVVNNPYLLYEATRLTTTPVGVSAVDRGMFPTALIRKSFPLPSPTEVKTAVDARRLRALVIRELERAAAAGDTLRPRDDIISDLRRAPATEEEQQTLLTGDLLAVAEEELFAGEIRVVKMADDRPAYQLERLAAVGDLIRKTIDKRVGAKRRESKVDWRAALDAVLPKLPAEPEEREKEVRAREEKTSALAGLAASRFSVLIGPAGTGKTTLLSVLCAQEDIHKQGVLLLAPTGKARVRMEEVASKSGITNAQAFTLAQFLNSSKRYDGKVQRYKITGESGKKGARTVIVDECSMLTEEMMAALIESLSGVDRLIFVGDYRQLPPIGAGRPFVDIVARLKPEDIETRFPRVGSAYAELTVPRRQGAGERDDLLLASWFGGSATGPGDDQVFEILSGERQSDTVKFVTWKTPDELEA